MLSLLGGSEVSGVSLKDEAGLSGREWLRKLILLQLEDLLWDYVMHCPVFIFFPKYFPVTSQNIINVDASLFTIKNFVNVTKCCFYE